MVDIPHDPMQFEQWRPFLRMLARMQLDCHLQAKIDPSDIVQQTMLDAHRGQAHYRGQTDEELRGWLRRILARNLADEIRKHRRHKRDANLEQSLHVGLQDSSAGLERCLAASDSSPDERAIRNEQLLRLTAAMEQLPEDQRQAVLLHHVQGFTSAAIAVTMGRTEISVAGLLRRGLKKLRQSMLTES